jgi:hypothetical protein
MVSHVYQIDNAEDFDAIRAGVQRFVVLRVDGPPPFAVGDVLYIRHGDRSTSTVLAVCKSLPGGFYVYGVERVWTHAQGGLEEEMVHKLELSCANMRLHSHPPNADDEQRAAALDVRNKATLLHLAYGGYRERKIG